jgi:hypothetical protein
MTVFTFGGFADHRDPGVKPEQKLQNDTEYPNTKITSHKPDLTQRRSSPLVPDRPQYVIRQHGKAS